MNRIKASSLYTHALCFRPSFEFRLAFRAASFAKHSPWRPRDALAESATRRLSALRLACAPRYPAPVAAEESGCRGVDVTVVGWRGNSFAMCKLFCYFFFFLLYYTEIHSLHNFKRRFPVI